MRRFEQARGQSTRYWQVLLEGSAITTESGLVGAEREAFVRRKVWPTAGVAREEVDRLVAERLRHGWTEAGGDDRPTRDGGVHDGPFVAGVDWPEAEQPRSTPAGAEEYTGGDDLIELYPTATPRDVDADGSDIPEEDAPMAAIEAHRAECQLHVEEWIARRVSVPRRVLAAVWADPDWRTVLERVHVQVTQDGAPLTGTLAEVHPAGVGVRRDGGGISRVPADVVALLAWVEGHV